MTYKTKNEVTTELKAAVDLVNNGRNDLDSLEIVKDRLIDQLWIKNIRGVVFGNPHPYAPDVDTKKTALDKAYSMFVSLLNEGEQPNICNVEDDGVGYYFTVSPCASGGIFDYAKPATDPITDEAPPKGNPVEDKKGRYFLSNGEIDDIGRLYVVDSTRIQYKIKTYKSLTTPHRSKDWEETE